MRRDEIGRKRGGKVLMQRGRSGSEAFASLSVRREGGKDGGV